MTEREDIALELARKITDVVNRQLDRNCEWINTKDYAVNLVAALLRLHVWQWIPVGERLPEIEHGWFLVYATRANGEKMMEKTYWFAEDGWGTLEDQGFQQPPRITHWAALPSAPGETKEKA